LSLATGGNLKEPRRSPYRRFYYKNKFFRRLAP